MQAELKRVAGDQEMSLLYPLLDANKHTLAADKAADAVDGRPCRRLVKAKGVKDARLYFDSEDRPPRRDAAEGAEPGAEEGETRSPRSRDYKAVAGMVVPMKSG